MNQFEIITRIIIAVIFGAILGLETETREVDEKGIRKARNDEHQRIGGVRTYSVISLIGAIAGLLFLEKQLQLVYMIFASLILLVVAAYILNVQWKHFFGMTTEIAVIITFLLGFLTTSRIIDLGITSVLLVLLTFFLSQKRGVGNFVKQINHQEIIDLTKFGLIALVILPLLPNHTYTVKELFEYVDISTLNLSISLQNLELINPFNIWLIVVLISGFNLLGYLFSKFVGAKSTMFAEGIFGGLVSSTSTIIALANQSKKNPSYSVSLINAGAALIANSVSFIQILLIIYISNYDLFKEIYMIFVIMGLLGFAIGSLIIFTTKSNSQNKIKLSSETFSLIPALKFISLIVMIKILIQIAQLSPYSNLFFVISSISGFVSMDAPTFAIADLNANNSISTNLAIAAILSANTFNFLAKGIYARMFGSKKFRNTLSLGLLLSLIASLIMLF